MNLEGKNIVITGASSGIGYQLLSRLLNKGCKVIAASRNISKSEFTHSNLYKLDCDISTIKGVDQLFDYALATFKTIDVYIANAGFAYYEKIEEPNYNKIDMIFKTNVFSAIYAAEKMKVLSEGRPYNVLVTASGISYISLPGYSLYASTKAALRGFADSYRYELDKGQVFQMVYPIATKTNFFIAAGDIPMAWPVQSAESVADKIIKGIEKNKNNIYPSLLFLLFKYMAGICPPLVKIYNRTSYKAFANWLKKNNK